MCTWIFSEDSETTNNGVSFGIARMQTASMRLDWQKYVGDCWPGLAVHFAAFANVVRIAGDSGLWGCGKFMGMDAANSGRASL